MKKLPIKRIDYFDKRLENKEYMDVSELNELLSGEIVIEEKIDGHAIYNNGIYYEDVRYKHTIHYNRLPQNIKENNFLVCLNRESNIDGKIIPCKENNAPILAEIRTIRIDVVLDLIDKLMNIQSQWSNEKVEGIVIKNYKKQLFGKISRFDFSNEIDENHLRKIKTNNY